MRAVMFGYDAPEPVLVEFLLVGGGGSCGSWAGGGGGGVVYCDKYQLYRKEHCVVIGQGCGCSSCLDKIVAYGGGGGGGGDGGSGGGGSATHLGNPGDGGKGCVGQGCDGGRGSNRTGGGGGGAGTAGCDGPNMNYGGAGGDGLAFDISGECCYYAGGGGGRSCTNLGANGLGADYYGGGGNFYNNNGGRGVFIVRYPTTCGYDISGGCKYECNGYCIHCFTSDGCLTVN